jgi:hypothetical protein
MEVMLKEQRSELGAFSMCEVDTIYELYEGIQSFEPDDLESFLHSHLIDVEEWDVLDLLAFAGQRCVSPLYYVRQPLCILNYVAEGLQLWTEFQPLHTCVGCNLVLQGTNC